MGKAGKAGGPRHRRSPFIPAIGPVRNFVCEAVHPTAGIVNRPSYSIANCRIAARQCGALRPHSAVMLRNANQINLVAASSFGKWPWVLMIFRHCPLTLSSALVV